MLRTLTTLLPCFVFLDWAVRLSIRRTKSVPQKYLLAVAILGAVTFFWDAVSMNPHPEYTEMAVMNVVGQASVFLMFPAFVLYLRKLEGKGVSVPVMILMGLPPVMLTGILIWVWFRVGLNGMADYIMAYNVTEGEPKGLTDRTYLLFQVFGKDVHDILIGVWIIAEWAFLLNIIARNGWGPRHLKEMFTGGRSENQQNSICIVSIVFFLACILKVAMRRYFLLDHPLIMGLIYTTIALSAACMFYIGYRFEGKPVSIPVRIPAEGMKEKSHEGLAGKFKDYMETKEAFRRADLSLEEVAADLSTNRTYLSEAVRQTTGTNFRAYLNTLRVEAAKKEMKEHPGDRLEAIAARTGFSSGSQMVKKFQEITGDTPRRWYKNQN